MTETQVPLSLYSEALDEIWRLRKLIAYEADRIDADLSLASFPKSRRQPAQNHYDRLTLAAKGKSQQAIADLNSHQMIAALLRAGAEPTLTRAQFEAEHPSRTEATK